MSTLYVDNLQPNLGSRVMAAGHVIQVKNISNSTQLATTAAGFYDIGLDISITPSSANSTFLLFGSIHANIQTNSEGYGYGFYRDATLLHDEQLMVYATAAGLRAGMSVSHIDSPLTISTITYKLRPRSFGSGTVEYNETNRSRSSFTVMEIAQ